MSTKKSIEHVENVLLRSQGALLFQDPNTKESEIRAEYTDAPQLLREHTRMHLETLLEPASHGTHARVLHSLMSVLPEAWQGPVTDDCSRAAILRHPLLLSTLTGRMQDGWTRSLHELLRRENTPRRPVWKMQHIVRLAMENISELIPELFEDTFGKRSVPEAEGEKSEKVTSVTRRCLHTLLPGVYWPVNDSHQAADMYRTQLYRSPFDLASERRVLTGMRSVLRAPDLACATYATMLGTEALQNMPSPSGKHPLREELRTEHAAEHIALYREHGTPLQQHAIEISVMHHVFANMLTYAYPDDEACVTEAGTPEFVCRERKLNCFTGAWATAAQLLNCGISGADLFYVNCLQENPQAGHGAILVRTAQKEAWLLDYGHKLIAPLRKRFVVEQGLYEQVLAGVHEYATLHCTDEAYNDEGFTRAFQILPLNRGLTARHLYHRALEFRRNGEQEAAAYAVELSHAANPHDPFVRSAFAEHLEAAGHTRQAEGEWLRSLQIMPNALLSLLSLAKAKLARGEAMQAALLADKAQVLVTRGYSLWSCDAEVLAKEVSDLRAQCVHEAAKTHVHDLTK